MINKILTKYNIFLKFLILNFFITLLISLMYPITNWESLNYNNLYFVFIALFSNTAIMYIVLSVLIFPIVIIENIKIKSIISSLVFTIFHLLIFADASIYRLYKFHFNSMVWNLITTEGAFDSVHLGFWTIATVIFFVLLLFIFLFWSSIKLFKESDSNKSKQIIPKIIYTLLILIIVDKSIYAYSDLYNNYEIIRFSKLYPLYQSFTMKRFAEKYLNFKVDRENVLKVDNKFSSLKYPLKEIDYNIQDKKNILLIVIDSWRYDMMDSLVTPNIYKFSKKCIKLNNHYSGGNATRFGIFSIFYALEGVYWHQFLAERKSPIFLDILQKNNYNFFIGSSTKLTYPEFRKTAFVNLSNYIYDELNGSEAKEKDPELKDLFLNFSKDKNKIPYFAFLFFDAPHGPYSYPAEYDVFKPSRTEINFITMNKKQAEAIKNTYKNAIRFDDYLIGEILNNLEKNKQLENTIVIITGDHGEEFYESGYSGHTSAFTKQQTQVATLVFIPNLQPENINYMTNHFDLVPTILTQLKSSANYEYFTNGENIFNKKKNYTVCSGWDNAGIIMNDFTIVFSTETYNAANFDIKKSDTYQPVNNFREVLQKKMPVIKEVINNLSKFKK